MAGLHRRLGIAHHAVVLHVVDDLEQRLAPERADREERRASPAAYGKGQGDESGAHELPSNHGVVPGVAPEPPLAKACELDVPSAYVAFDRGYGNVGIDVPAARRRRGVFDGRYVAVVAVDVLD